MEVGFLERFTYRAIIRHGEEDAAAKACRELAASVRKPVDNGDIMTASMFIWGRHLFAYYECTGREYTPGELFSAADRFLENWPGEEPERKWVRMMDIYHCVEPVSVEHWRRKAPVKTITARLMRLKPEMLSSYIFYHWQLQEETPGNWCKYCSIYLNENLTVMFNEDPDPPEAPPYKGKLNTSNTPDNWAELMFNHCIPWEDVEDESQKMWRKTEPLWSLYG
jgi:hypothetical protein